jgi:hypothetical protein
MSNSRFVLKQIPVRGAGASDLARYVAKSKLDSAREGKRARSLYTADADRLTFREARTWLSVTSGALLKSDLLHYVLSFENAREYELLGKDDEERERETVTFLRRSLTASLREIGIEEMHWVVGIHRNTDNPHIHLLLNKNAIQSETSDLVRVPRLPAPVIAHYTKTPEGEREFSYGLFIKLFAAEVDARHRERIRFLQFENALRTVAFTPELLAPEVLRARRPTGEERLIGRWLIAEIETARPPQSLRIGRAYDSLQETKINDELNMEADSQFSLADLRKQALNLDRASLERGEGLLPAFIETDALRDVLRCGSTRAITQRSSRRLTAMRERAAKKAC